MNEVFQTYGFVNYFDYTTALSDLIASGHILVKTDEAGEEFFVPTESGLSSADALERTLPLSIREKAVTTAIRLLTKVKRESKNKVEIEKVSDGYQVTCRVLDVGTDLMRVSLFVPDKLEANQVKENFLNDPELFYRGLISLFTGDFHTFDEISYHIRQNSK